MKSCNMKRHNCGKCLYAGGSPLRCSAAPDKCLISELDKYFLPKWCPLDGRGKEYDTFVRSPRRGVVG